MSDPDDGTPQPGRKILLFVHGMYGSNLCNPKTGEQAWLSVSTIASGLLHGNRGHFRDSAGPTNGISWSTDGGEYGRDEFEPQSTIEMFTGPWSEWCASLDPEAVDVRNFLWDWRRPMDETHKSFERWVLDQGLSASNQATLVTFSTAALFAWPVVNQHPQLFSGWLDVGGAVGGGNFMISDFANGWFKGGGGVAGSICLIDAETLFTIPSLYVFFFKDSDTGETVAVGDLYSVETWRAHGLGIFGLRSRQSRDVSAEEEAHLRNSLAAAERFRRAHYVRPGAISFEDPAFLVHPRAAYGHLDLCHFGSESNDKTHCGWCCEGEKLTLPLQEVHGRGDGTLMTWAWKIRTGGLTNHRIVHCSDGALTHVELMTDPLVQATAAEMLGIPYVAAPKKKPKMNAGVMGGALLAALAAAAYYGFSL